VPARMRTARRCELYVTTQPTTLGTIIRTVTASEQGITGLETAIVLIAFVVAASVFSFAALSAGMFSSDSQKDVSQEALSKARSTIQLLGSVIADDTDTDGNVDRLTFLVGNAAGGEGIPLIPGNAFVRYSDYSQTVVFDSSAKFSATPVGNADADNLIEPGEIFQLALLAMESNLTTMLTRCRTFVIEVITPKGAVLHIERSTPSVIDRSPLLGGRATCAAPASTTVSFTAVADSTVRESGGGNQGTDVQLRVRSFDTARNFRAFVQFDVSTIPAGSTINTATLTLCVVGLPDTTRTIDVHLVTGAWGELTILWGNQPSVAASPTDSITTPAAVGCITWAVASDVQAWVDGTANNGWRTSDSVEDSVVNEQTDFRSREDSAFPAEQPELQVTYTP